MNLQEIRNEAWTIAREVGRSDQERLWTTAEMNRYINRTYRQIARETRCIRDAFTQEVCRIEVAPPATLTDLQTLALTNVFAADDLLEYNREGSWLYHRLVSPRIVPIHKSIIDIDEVKWKNWPWRLTQVSVSKWQINPYWERVMGSPTEVAKDYQTGYLAFNFRTSETDTLMMTVRRLPLVDLAANTDVPEFRDSYHDYFINGVLFQMYSKQDSQAFDMKKAAEYEIAFLRDIDEIKQQETIYDQRLHVNTPMAAFL